MARKKNQVEEPVAPIEEEFWERDTTEVLDEAMARYSEEVVLRRAIPDARDGLKVVQRRVMYTMFDEGNLSNKPFRKVASITGATMGRFHPHGDSSIEQALVVLSQEWKNQHKLVNIEGNNGSIDGDGAAAARYIEARMTKEAELLFHNLSKGLVKHQATYDNRGLEPTVLPARWPVLFTNGADGVAVGFSTAIAPHNVKELLNAAIYVNKNPGATLKKIMQFVPAPDFPTGGRLIGDQDAIRELFEKGRGKVVVRVSTEREGNSIVITSVPYGSTKSDLLQSIDKAIESGKLASSFSHVEDESSGDDVRVVLTVKRGIDVDAVENYLFSKSIMQSNSISRNICIVNGRPAILPLLDYLHLFVDFRRQCIRRYSELQLEKMNARMHIVEGFVRMTQISDEIIAAIKRSNGKKDSRETLVREFDFSEAQAEAIVSMALYKISRQDVQELFDEKDVLDSGISFHEKVLNDDDFLVEETHKELKDTLAKFKDTHRRTEIIDPDEVEETTSITASDLKKAESAVVTVSSSSAQRMTRAMYQGSMNAPAMEVRAVHDSSTDEALVMFTRTGLTMQRIVEDLEHKGLKSEAGSFVREVGDFSATDEILTSATFPAKWANSEEGSKEDRLLSRMVVVSISKMGQIKKSLLKDSLLSFGNKGYISRTKKYNGLKLKDDSILFVAIMDEDKVGELKVSLRRKSGGRVVKPDFAELNLQGAVGSGTNAIKITKPNDEAMITTTNVGNLTDTFYFDM